MTNYEKTLLHNVSEALINLNKGAVQTAGRIALQEVECYAVYGCTGADRLTWVKPLVDICTAILMLMDEDDRLALDFRMRRLWPIIMRLYEQFSLNHGAEADG